MKNSHQIKYAWTLLKFYAIRTLPIWCLIALMIFLVQVAVCGMVHDNKTLNAMLGMLDLVPFFKTALGGEYLQAGNVPALITIGYKHPFVLFLYMFFAVSVPTGLLTGEVQKGIMELILSSQVSKLHVYICAGLITVTGMFALVMIMYLGTVTSVHIFDFGKQMPLDMFFRIAIDGGLFASTIGAIALLCAALFSSRSIASGIAVTFLVTNYFVSIFSEWWPRMAFLKGATIFKFIAGEEIMIGWPLRNMCALIIIFLIAIISGAIIWKRRDLPL